MFETVGQTAHLACSEPGVPEIFETIQGEGPSTGAPATFVRFARCNLHCAWCDTPYTWNWKGAGHQHRAGVTYDPRTESVSTSVEAAARTVLSLRPDLMVFTGGEPLLQQRTIIALLSAVRAQRPAMTAEIETNGTVMPAGGLLEAVQRFNVSPKLAHSGNDLSRRREDVLRRFAQTGRAVFKFVVREPTDIDEVAKLVGLAGMPAERVYLMPEGIDRETLDARAEWLVPLAIARGYRFADRLHIRLFGHARGT